MNTTPFTLDPDPLLLTPALATAHRLEARAIRWIWPARIPAAKLTLLLGDPGVGKSLLCADLAARVSAGYPWPTAPLPPVCESSLAPTSGISFGDPPPPSSSGSVVIACAEDDPFDTLIPRLRSTSADLARITILAGVTHRHDPTARPARLTLPAHAHVLAEAIAAQDHPRLVILDPFTAFIQSAADFGSTGLNALFDSLAEIAEQFGVAILAVGHLTKARAHRMLYRARGSLAFVAAARSVMLLASDPTDAARRVFLPLKTVYGPPAAPLAFRIAPGPKLAWTPAADVPADLTDLGPENTSALLEASDWLTDALAAGPQPAADLLTAARRAGISRSSLHRAKRLLSVRSQKPLGAHTWVWTLDQPPSESAPAQIQDTQIEVARS